MAGVDRRKLRSFPADLGTEMRFGAQSARSIHYVPSHGERSNNSRHAPTRGPIMEGGARTDRVASVKHAQKNRPAGLWSRRSRFRIPSLTLSECPAPAKFFVPRRLSTSPSQALTRPQSRRRRTTKARPARHDSACGRRLTPPVATPPGRSRGAVGQSLPAAPTTTVNGSRDRTRIGRAARARLDSRGRRRADVPARLR
jgi:hypothetical protein